MEIGESLTEFVTTHLETLSTKYFGHIVTCRVVFAKNSKGQNFHCNIQVGVGHDMFYAGEGESNQIHPCFNQAYEHVAKQLRRKKRKLHEDKPEGHKDDVLKELNHPANFPINGDDLSIADIQDHQTEP